MPNKSGFSVVFAAMLAFWLLLTGFNLEELMAGTINAAFVAIMCTAFFRPSKKNYLKRLYYLAAAIPLYVRDEAVTHARVVRLIITGRISPAIVELKHSHTTDFGVMALANSITMTPGTLALEVGDGSLFIHQLDARAGTKGISGISGLLKRIWD
jgi:multicomponent Na+:H+ antiporter subunit E